MIYICGDSFGTPDPEYGPCWVDMLSQHLPVVTLAQVCASNLMIAMQVDQAIQAGAEYIIVLFTASTRGEIMHKKQLTPYSIHSLDFTTPFNVSQLDILRKHTVEFFDLDLAIYKNRCIIEAVLNRLQRSGIPFRFDQGGFEHKSYGGTGTYFAEYDQYRSSINLWDHAPRRDYRPYYHIQDAQMHQQIATHYRSLICAH